jgi:hypothetical protein
VCCTVLSDGGGGDILEGEDPKPEQKWEPMRLTLLGKVGDVVRVGMGKLSSVLVDPGEPKKTQPSG